MTAFIKEICHISAVDSQFVSQNEKPTFWNHCSNCFNFWNEIRFSFFPLFCIEQINLMNRLEGCLEIFELKTSLSWNRSNQDVPEIIQKRNVNGKVQQLYVIKPKFLTKVYPFGHWCTCRLWRGVASGWYGWGEACLYENTNASQEQENIEFHFEQFAINTSICTRVYFFLAFPKRFFAFILFASVAVSVTQLNSPYYILVHFTYVLEN